MKTTKKNKTTSSVVVTPAAPASPGGCTIGLDLGGSQSLPLRAGCHRPVDSTENQSCASLGEHTRPACGFRRPAETSSHHPSPGQPMDCGGLLPLSRTERHPKAVSPLRSATAVQNRPHRVPPDLPNPGAKTRFPLNQGKTPAIKANRALSRQMPNNESHPHDPARPGRRWMFLCSLRFKLPGLPDFRNSRRPGAS